MSVLILSTSSNPHANAIEEHLEKNQNKTLRINTDSFFQPCNYSITENKLIIGDREIDPEEISGVFVHHPLIEFPTIDANEFDRQLWLSAWKNFLKWIEDLFQKAVWVNKPTAISLSSSLKFQLDLAKETGFKTPGHLLTNDISQLEQFAKIYHELVVKSGPLLAGNLEGHRVLTRKINPKNIDANVLKKSPCLFQEYIDKKFELRINVIGNTILACQILSQQSEKSKIDWRNYDLANTPYFPYELDKATKSMCISIARQLWLCYATIDLIVTNDDKIYFLECNSQGSWLWIEKLTGLPITKAIVDALI